MKTKNPDKSGAVDLTEKDLDRVQGGGANLFPAGQGGLDLATTEGPGPGQNRDNSAQFPGLTKYPVVKLARASE